MPIQPSPKARKAIAKDHLPRGPIARETQWRIEDLGLTRAQAALLVKDAASQLSRLMTGHVHEFSADRLIGMLVGLGSDVEVIIRHPKGRKGKGKVSVRAVRK
jgi:predicted XRE-type DNA-binding protein